LKDENGRLYKLLGERDEEMRILRKARDEEKRALAGENFNIHIYNVYKLYCCVTLQSLLFLKGLGHAILSNFV